MAIEQARQSWAVLLSGAGEENDDATVPTLRTSVDCGYGPVRIGLGSANERRLLIPVGEAAEPPVEMASERIRIGAARLTVSGTLTRFIDVQCVDERLFHVFASVVDEMLLRMTEGAPPVESICAVLNEYRSLLRRTRPSLSLQEVLGAIGELYFLHRLLKLRPASLAAWQGPKGGRHDFVASGVSLEVKSALRASSLTVKISSIDQLLPIDGAQLFLAHLVFEESPAGLLALPSLIESIRSEPIDGELFSELLSRIGLADIQDDPQLRQLKFRLLSNNIYLVDDSLPRIIPDSFTSGGIPEGVVRLQYTIDLSCAERCRVPRHLHHDLFEKFAAT